MLTILEAAVIRHFASHESGCETAQIKPDAVTASVPWVETGSSDSSNSDWRHGQEGRLQGKREHKGVFLNQPNSKERPRQPDRDGEAYSRRSIR